MWQEEAVYEYSPTLGGLLFDHPKVDPRMLAASQSGVDVARRVSVTTHKLLVYLESSALRQVIPIAFSEITAIVASSNLLDLRHGVAIHDEYGPVIHMSSTRPHVVAVDIWTWIAVAVGALYERQGSIQAGVALLKSYDVSSLRVPDDYYSMRREQIDSLLPLGFSFPINSYPCIDSLRLPQQFNKPTRSASMNQRPMPTQLNDSKSGTLARNSDLNNSKPAIFYLPALQMGANYRLERWLVKSGDIVAVGQQICTVFCATNEDFQVLSSMNNGAIDILVGEDSSISVGQSLAHIWKSDQDALVPRKSAELVAQIQNSSTLDALKAGKLEVSPGTVPVFTPSVASLPLTFKSLGTVEEDLRHAIAESPTYFQSFYNDLCPVTSVGIDDDVISANCFDEGIYCALVREVHRYSQAQVLANQDEIAKKNAGLGAIVGSFLGLITGNIFAPFLGHTYGNNMTDRSKRIEEFLPDPNLLFSQDPNSFMSWSRGQVSSPRLRRLIFDRQINEDNEVFFRILPAIVTADSIFPVQLFKLDSSTYFYRPFSAGIGDAEGRKQPNYDPIKIQRKYFHIRREGATEPLDIALKVYGRDIEEHTVKLNKFTGQSLDYIYADFKIQPGSVF